MIQVFATFNHSHYIELAISKLRECGITRIYAVPMDKQPDDINLVDSVHGTDGTSLVDLGLILAMMFGTIGVSRGYVLEWGPVFWGITGAAAGFAFGFVIDLIKNLIKRKKLFTTKPTHAEIILMVQCEANQLNIVENTLKENRALGLAKIRY